MITEFRIIGFFFLEETVFFQKKSKKKNPVGLWVCFHMWKRVFPDMETELDGVFPHVETGISRYGNTNDNGEK